MGKKDVIGNLKNQIAQLQSGSFVNDGPRKDHVRRGQSSEDGNNALKRIVSWVNVSERSTRYVRERLEREGFTSSEIDEALSRAHDYGYIDDMRFASSLIRSRLAQGKGIEGVKRELATHNIELQDVPGWPYEFVEDAEDETARALRFLESHPPKSKNKREGAFRKLVQKGYSTSAASSAARQWFETHS